jgi:hypothetical protein
MYIVRLNEKHESGNDNNVGRIIIVWGMKKEGIHDIIGSQIIDIINNIIIDKMTLIIVMIIIGIIIKIGIGMFMVIVMVIGT